MLLTLHLQNLKANTLIGVREHEKTTPQPLKIEIKITYEAQKAAQSDRLEHALDYSKLAKSVKKFIESRSFGLLEHLIHELSSYIQKHFKYKKIFIKIHKPNALNNLADISIEYEQKGCLK